jgi:tetratricopeptide (TPR) repeat protein
MKTTINKHNKVDWILFMIFVFSALSFAQFEDAAFLDEQAPVICIPETLQTVYDQYKQTDLSETNLKMWYSFGSEYYKQKDYKAALPWLWKVFVNDTSKMGQYAIRKISDGYFNLHYVDSTLLACYRGLERYPELAGLHYYAGSLQANMGKNECALPHYEFLVERYPNDETYLDKLAYIYFKLEDERAIDVQKRLVEVNPENPEYHTRLVFYLEHFDYDPLLELRAAFEKDPEDVKIIQKLIIAELGAGNYQQAVEKATILLDKDPEQKAILKLRAQAYEGLTEYTKAIIDYKSILKIKPSDLENICNIATDYKFLNKFAEGKYWVKKAITVNSRSGLPHIVMAEIYEAAVPYSQQVENRGRKIDDGFVYERAIAEYEEASKDPAYKAYANQRIKLLEPLKPTQEELFFAQGNTKLKYESYTSWIDQ